MKVLVMLLSVALGLIVIDFSHASGQAEPYEGYRLGPNDTLRIQVYGEEDLSLETKVEGDGQITYPLLGILQVGGLTIHELQHDLTTRLAAGYLSKPKVTVTVARHRNFYVGGEVRVPGGYPYEEGLTVQKAITLAGGFTEKSDKRVITITRAHGSQVDILTLESDAMVRPDDLVAVAQARKFYVNGEVRRAGDYPYERELTLHKAITMAGGFTDKAATSRAKVIRKIEGKEQEISLDLEGIILPEDIIVVPRSFF
jgi:protein involved in polysaccharide export with SLBB domain